MLLGIRDTAVIPPFGDALPAGAISNRRQPSCPSDQNASCIDPLAPTHHISMLLDVSSTLENRLGQSFEAFVIEV
jgi:hypothetical protein